MRDMSGSGCLIRIGNRCFVLLVQPDLGVEFVGNSFIADEGTLGIIDFIWNIFVISFDS